VSDAIQAVRGMNDVLPDEAELRIWLDGVVAAWFARYGYRPIRTPLLEHTALFRRAIGEATDIVEKEMYTFTDALNNESLTLRPEATASTVRAAIEHSLVYDGPKRLWYAGPMYRHERPQKGRYREFTQFGAEAFGYAGPDVDAELIVMCAALWRELGASLTGADLIVVTDVYGAAQEPIPGVTGKLVVDGLALAERSKRVVYLPHRGDVVRFLEREVREGDLVLTMGCGDVWMLGDAALDAIREADS